MTAKERRDAADRAKYDGLTLQEVNALVRATRYPTYHEKPAFKKHREKFIQEGYWDPKGSREDGDIGGGYPSARGQAVVRIAYGIEQGHRSESSSSPAQTSDGVR
jgi:hypothetical protein